MKALQQLLHDVDWGGLDVLVLDMPPGTGDTQLTITQQVELDGKCFVNLLARISLIYGFPRFICSESTISNSSIGIVTH